MIVAQGLKDIHIPRHEPWGPSNFINGVTVEQGDDSAVALTIEMQSGDQVTLICQSFRITHPGSD